MVATTGLVGNFFINHRSLTAQNPDQSAVFSYLKNNPDLNNPLLSKLGTTTILAKSDEWVNQALASNFGSATLTSMSGKSSASDPTTIQENVIVKTNPSDTDHFLRAGRTVYEVTKGDSVVSIASNFGISPETVMIENKLDESAILHPGQKLTILATTGITHVVVTGETIESIAAKYKISEDDILDANDLELPDDIVVGEPLVIPLQQVNLPAKPKPAPRFVKDESNKIAFKQVSVPDIAAGALSFLWPTATHQISQGFHRRHSGIDISNSQMIPVYASEDGIVEISGYQKGYGNTIIINHGNGFKTRYAHASELYVSAGDPVARGQVIAKQGRTGRVRGATGIHLHFEIIKNGLRVNPLSYVKP